MTPGEVGALLILVTIREASRLYNIVPLPTAGITPKSRIQPTTFTISPRMIPIVATCETTTFAPKTPVAVGRRSFLQKTHVIPPQVESGPSATFRPPMPQSVPGPPTAKGLMPMFNVKADRIGGRKGRAGIGTMGAVTVGVRTTHGSHDKVATLVANTMIGSVGISTMTVLNATQKIGHGSLLRRGNRPLGAVRVAKTNAIKTINVTRIGTGTAGEVKKVATTTSKDEISGPTIVT